VLVNLHMPPEIIHPLTPSADTALLLHRGGAIDLGILAVVDPEMAMQALVLRESPLTAQYVSQRAFDRPCMLAGVFAVWRHG
jgi:hypothetical protein